MRTPARYLLALTLVASALCADRATAAVARADLTPARTGGLVDRLSVAFRRTVSAPPLVRPRCGVSTTATLAPAPVPARTAPAAVAPRCPACLPQPPPGA